MAAPASNTQSQSWRVVGGYSSYQQLNSVTTNNLATDTFNMRSAYVGLWSINGRLRVSDYSFFDGDTFTSADAWFFGNIHAFTKIDLGPNDSNYFFGNDYGIGLNTLDPSYTLDIHGTTSNILNVKTINNSTENFLCRNNTDQTVSVGSDSSNQPYSSAFLNFYDSSSGISSGLPNSEFLSTNDCMYVKTKKDLIVQSRMIVANTSLSFEHLNTEIFTVYSTPSTIFHYDIFGNVNAQTGTCITGLALDNESTAFITLNARNGQGMGLGGGILPNSSQMSYATLGTYDICGYYVISQAIVSSQDASERITKKSCVAFNNCGPEYGIYVLDVNGPIHLRMCELNMRHLNNFEYNCMNFIGLNGIAVGSPITIPGTNGFVQIASLTIDGGITWHDSQIQIGIDGLGLAPYSFNCAIFDGSQAIIAGDNNFICSLDYTTTMTMTHNTTWKKIIYSTSGDYTSNIGSTTPTLLSNTKPNIKLVLTTGANAKLDVVTEIITTTAGYISNGVLFGGYYTDVLDTSSNYGIYFYDLSSTYRYKITPFPSQSIFNVTSVTGINNTIFFVGDVDGSGTILETIFEGSTNTLTLLNIEIYPEITFNYVHVDDLAYTGYAAPRVFAIGTRIVYRDRGAFWQISPYIGHPLYGLDILDEFNVVAVGEAGTFIYSTDRGVNWKNVPDETLNAYGNRTVLVNDQNRLKHVRIYDKTTFIISFVNSHWSISHPNVNGLSKIYHCYLPTLFDRASVSLLDVCGSICITGDIHTTEGGTVYIDGSEYVQGEIVTRTSLSVTGDKDNFNYIATIGSISNPSVNITQGTLSIQGQNGLSNYHTWNFSVGALEAGTSSYNSERLRFIDSTEAEIERMTIDIYGQVGIATSTPQSVLDISGITTVSSTFDSTSPETGTLQVKGGAGIIKNLYVGGHAIVTNIEETYSATSGALQVWGGAGFGKSLWVGGNVKIQGNEIATGPMTGGLQVVNGGAGIYGSLFTGGNVTIQELTNPTNPQTGALIITRGGAGISGSVFTGGNVTIQELTNPTNPQTGALIITRGGAGISGSVFTGGNVTIQDPTNSTSPGTGALIVTRGGVGIAGNVFLQTNQTTFGTITSKVGFYIEDDEPTNVDFFGIIGSI